MNNKLWAWIFTGLSLIILGIFAFVVIDDGFVFWGGTEVNFSVTGQVGDFIGGVVGTIISGAGFYFLYITFQEQRLSFAKERLESKFFDLIKLHRDNVSELRFDATRLSEDDDSLFIEKVNHESKAVFRVIFHQFIMCKNELAPFFKEKKMFRPEYEAKLLQDPYVIKNNVSLKTLAMTDICYSIIFYGLSSEGLLILDKLFKDKYKDKFVNDILRFISLKPANNEDILKKWLVVSGRDTRGKRNDLVDSIYTWRKTKRTSSDNGYTHIALNYHNRYIKYYGGHQFRLGHYFRHLYQVVKYVNSQKEIDYKTKYEYIKILRAQLSTYEQAILFINCLSKMGEPWELKPETTQINKKFKKEDFELITKYNLIKNLPGESLYGIHFKEFFPLVEFESDSHKKERPKYN